MECTWIQQSYFYRLSCVQYFVRQIWILHLDLFFLCTMAICYLRILLLTRASQKPICTNADTDTALIHNHCAKETDRLLVLFSGVCSSTRGLFLNLKTVGSNLGWSVFVMGINGNGGKSERVITCITRCFGALGGDWSLIPSKQVGVIGRDRMALTWGSWYPSRSDFWQAIQSESVWSAILWWQIILCSMIAQSLSAIAPSSLSWSSPGLA